MTESQIKQMAQIPYIRSEVNSPGSSRAIIRTYLPLFGLGAAFEVLLLLMQVLAPELGWYPSRLGMPAEWLDGRIYAPARLLLYHVTSIYPMLPAIAFFAILGLLFALYGLAARYAWRRRGDGSRKDATLIIALGFPAIFMLSLLSQPYLSSQDIFSYAFYSHMSALYGGNPYVGVPRDYSFDPLYSAIFWTDQSSNYGPLWTGIGILITSITGTNTPLTLFGIKLVSILFAIGTIPLVWKSLGKMAPDIRLAGTVLYAWNPLLILETAGSGHNDSVVAFFVVLGLYLYARNNKLAGLIAIVLSALAKYVTVVVLPLYLALWLRDCASTRERLLTLAKFGATTITLLSLAYLPVYSGLATFQVARFGTSPSGYVNSPLELAFREIRVLLGEPRELATLPLKPHASWVLASGNTILRAAASDSAPPIATVSRATQLLIVEPQAGSWMHVYAPRLDEMGYVASASTLPATASDAPDPATTLAAITQLINGGARSQQANLILRLAAGLLFLAIVAALAWKSRTYQHMLYASLALLVASYWLLETWFWPWYLIWALPLAAMVPRRRLAVILFVFSLTSLTLHGPGDGPPVAYVDFIYEYRSIPVFGLPILAVAFLFLLPWFRRKWRGPLIRPPRPVVVASSALLLATIGVAFAGKLAQAEDGYRLRQSSGHSFANVSVSTFTRNWLSPLETGKRDFQETAATRQRLASIPADSPANGGGGTAGIGQIRQFDQAIAEITRVMDIQGADEELLLSRGRAYQQTQRFELAIEDFDRAISFNGADPSAYRYRAQSYFQLGLMDEAIDSQRTALALASHSAEMYVELAGMYATLGRFREAQMIYDLAISMDTRAVDAYVGRASVSRILKQNDDAVADLRQVLNLTRDDVQREWALRMIDMLQNEENP